MGIDLEKAGKLGYDIKKLESMKSVLESENEKLQNKIAKDTKETEKALAQLVIENESSVKTRLAEVVKKEALVERKLKTISTRETESEGIEEDRKKLAYAKAEIVDARKIVEVNNAKCLEMTTLAKLRTEQLAKTLEELGKKPKELPVKEVKKESKKIKK